MNLRRCACCTAALRDGYYSYAVTAAADWPDGFLGALTAAACGWSGAGSMRRRLFLRSSIFTAKMLSTGVRQRPWRAARQLLGSRATEACCAGGVLRGRAAGTSSWTTL